MSDNGRSVKIMGTNISFLLLFAPKTLAKRIAPMILLTADVPIPRVVELSGLCERSVRELGRAMAEKVVHIVLDNARYQKCRDVCALAAELGLDLIYLPPYSPNLNLIERLWKFVKGELRSMHYDSFPAFRERIDAIISSLSDKNKAAVSKLIGKSLQIFDGLALLCPNTFVIAS